MYCSKCGKQIPDDSSFCPECGSNCNGGGKTINATATSVDMNKHKNYLLTTLKSPVTVMQNGLAELSLKAALMYGVVITLIIPLIKTLSAKMSVISKISRENYDIGYTGYLERKLYRGVSDGFPTGDIYIINLLSYVLFYGIIILIIYFVYKSLLKENISQENLGNIFFAFSVINLVMTIISVIALQLGLMFWAIISIFSLILSIILIYAGFNSIVEGKNKLVYLFSFSYLVSLGITLMVLIKRLVMMGMGF